MATFVESFSTAIILILLVLLLLHLLKGDAKTWIKSKVVASA